MPPARAALGFSGPSARAVGRVQGQAGSTRGDADQNQRQRQAESAPERQLGAERARGDAHDHDACKAAGQLLTRSEVGPRSAFRAHVGTGSRDRKQPPEGRRPPAVRALRHFQSPRDQISSTVARALGKHRRHPSVAARVAQDRRGPRSRVQLGRFGPGPSSQRSRTFASRRRDAASRLVNRTAKPVGVVRTTSEGSSISKEPG